MNNAWRNISLHIRALKHSQLGIVKKVPGIFSWLKMFQWTHKLSLKRPYITHLMFKTQTACAIQNVTIEGVCFPVLAHFCHLSPPNTKAPEQLRIRACPQESGQGFCSSRLSLRLLVQTLVQILRSQIPKALSQNKWVSHLQTPKLNGAQGKHGLSSM